MRNVWATVVSVWLMLAVVGVLAWTRQPVGGVAGGRVATTLVVRGKNGATQRLVLVGAATTATPHATTQSSPPPP